VSRRRRSKENDALLCWARPAERTILESRVAHPHAPVTPAVKPRRSLLMNTCAGVKRSFAWSQTESFCRRPCSDVL